MLVNHCLNHIVILIMVITKINGASWREGGEGGRWKWLHKDNRRDLVDNETALYLYCGGGYMKPCT